MNGFINLHRSFLEWEHHQEPNTVTMFIHLLCLARWQDTEYKGETLHRGELSYTNIELADITGLSVQNVKTALTNLEKTQELTRVTTPKKHRIIRIVNYDKYQPNLTTNPTPNLSITQQQINKDNNINNIHPYVCNYIYNTRAREGVIGKLKITGATKEQMDEARASL